MPPPTPAPTESAYRKEFERQQGRLRQALDSRSDPRLEQLLAEVTQALERMQGGRYGICESCHESIEPETLAANPLIGFCLDHLSAPERRRLQDDLELVSCVIEAFTPARAPSLCSAGL